MATTTVTGTITDPAGTPLPDVPVMAVLVAPQGAYLADDTAELVSRVETTTDDDGEWSLALTPNTGIVPAGTSYRVTRLVAGRAQVNTITVPSSGPVEFAAILTDASVVGGLAAGGVLAGTYPDPSFAVDMATQAELNAHVAAVDPHADRAYTDTQVATRQPLDADLTAVAALTPTNDDILQRKAGAWVNRTIAQVKTDLGLAAVATSGSGDDITTGTVADARIASTIARDTEVTSAVSTHAAASDPHGDRAYTAAQVATTRATATRARVPAPGLAFMGDSITAFNSSVGNAWHRVLCFAADQQVRHAGHYATSGYTLAQIESTHLPSVLAATPLPGACVIAGGTNDVGAVGYSEATSKATHTRIVDALIAAGIMPVLWTLPPRDDDTTVNGYVHQWNAWIRGRGAALGVPVVDAHAALVDPTTGLYDTTLKLDDVHPNDLGHLRIGLRAGQDAAFVARFSSGVPHLALDVLDTANLLPSGQGLFVADANSDGRADGWNTFGTGVTYSIMTDTAVPGNWQRLSVGSGAFINAGMQYTISSGITVGHVYALSGRSRLNLDPAASVTAVISGQWRDGSGAIAGAATLGTSALLRTEAQTQGVFYGTGTAPAGATILRLTASFNGTPSTTITADYAQVTVIDLTALGLA